MSVDSFSRDVVVKMGAFATLIALDFLARMHKKRCTTVERRVNAQSLERIMLMVGLMRTSAMRSIGPHLMASKTVSEKLRRGAFTFLREQRSLASKTLISL